MILQDPDKSPQEIPALSNRGTCISEDIKIVPVVVFLVIPNALKNLAAAALDDCPIPFASPVTPSHLDTVGFGNAVVLPRLVIAMIPLKCSQPTTDDGAVFPCPYRGSDRNVPSRYLEKSLRRWWHAPVVAIQ